MVRASGFSSLQACAARQFRPRLVALIPLPGDGQCFVPAQLAISDHLLWRLVSRHVERKLLIRKSLTNLLLHDLWSSILFN